MNNPNYTGVTVPEPVSPPEVIPRFPAHFGFAVNRSKVPSAPPAAPPPEPKEGVPLMGPYTVSRPIPHACIGEHRVSNYSLIE